MSELERTNPALPLPSRQNRRELIRQLRMEQEGKTIPGYAEYLTQMESLDTLMESLSTRDSWGVTKPLTDDDKQKLTEAIQNTAMAGETYLQNVRDAAKEGKKVSLKKGAPGVVNKLQGMLAADSQTIQHYDPSLNLDLPHLLETGRTKTLVLGSQEMDTVGGNQNSRIPLSIENANGKKYRGVFTKATYSRTQRMINEAMNEVADDTTPAGKEELKKIPQKLREYARQKYPPLANLDDTRLFLYMVQLHTSTGDRGGRKSFLWRDFADNLKLDLNAIGEDTMRLFGNKVIGIHNKTSDMINTLDLKIEEGARIDSRNSAMSAVSDLLNVPKLVARSTNMRFIDEEGRVMDGTIMDFSPHLDLNDTREVFNQVNDHPLEGENAYKAIKQMADLQVLDYICGNVDRHAGNLMYEVNEQGEIIGVQGIDNDSSFGNFGPLTERFNRLPGPDNMNCVTKSMVNTIMKMEPAMLRFALRGRGLSDKEMDFACKRLKDLKKAIQKGNEHYKNHPKIDADTKQPFDKGFLRTVSDEEFKHLKMNQMIVDNNQYNLFSEINSWLGVRIQSARKEGHKFDPNAKKNAEEKELKTLRTQDQLYTGLSLQGSIKGAGKLVSDGTFNIDDLTKKSHGGSEQFENMVNSAKKLAQLEAKLNREMELRRQQDNLHFSAVEYNRFQQPIADAKRELRENTMTYLNYKMGQKHVNSLEDLRGKNTYERERIAHAKHILEFTDNLPDAPKITEEVLQKQDGEGLEIRIGNELSAEEEAKAAMKMLKDIHKQHGLAAPEEMKGMDGALFNETLDGVLAEERKKEAEQNQPDGLEEPKKDPSSLLQV